MSEIYFINTTSRPTKVVEYEVDWKAVYPKDIEFHPHTNSCFLEDRTYVEKSSVQQGLPVHGEGFPKELKWGHGELKKGLPDFEHFRRYLVSDPMRKTIESLEPDTHQFFPVRIFWKNGESDKQFYWFNVCNSLDFVNREHTTHEYRERSNSYTDKPGGKYVYDVAKTKGKHIWIANNMGLKSVGMYISGACKEAFETAGLTGIKFFEREAV